MGASASPIAVPGRVCVAIPDPNINQGEVYFLPLFARKRVNFRCDKGAAGFTLTWRSGNRFSVVAIFPSLPYVPHKQSTPPSSSLS